MLFGPLGNARMRRQVARRFAIVAGFVGAVIDLALLLWIAESLFPGAL